MYIRTEPNALKVDAQLKLRIANALHTAMVLPCHPESTLSGSCLQVHVAVMAGVQYVHEAMAIPVVPQFLAELYHADIRPSLMRLAVDYDMDVDTISAEGDLAFEVMDWHLPGCALSVAAAGLDEASFQPWH